MLRGNERRSVFLDEKDKDRFIEIMLQKKEAAASRLFAFCVMDNHVHMVIQESVHGQPLETLMKRIGCDICDVLQPEIQAGRTRIPGSIP